MMVISELIGILQERLMRHGDVEVEVTWEGQVFPLSRDSVYITNDGELYIDADGNFYKRQYAVKEEL